jgi:hypothetical protein
LNAGLGLLGQPNPATLVKVMYEVFTIATISDPSLGPGNEKIPVKMGRDKQRAAVGEHLSQRFYERNEFISTIQPGIQVSLLLPPLFADDYL